ncbi:RNA polymerase sigma factor [Fodinicola feengrottensis]|uniref:SigE family RNA polymerase sigma factor n=1 Tax=Fodinicola feengrottensis TaxID=435914 RepID=A0ABN2GPX9_9ACTN|nr:SigE family RNA polymerase sigma factor [Fodinicola feengrottensis]
MTDEQLTAQERLEELFRATHQRLVLSMFALTGDMVEAEDVVQEAFVRAVIHSRKLLAADNPEGWLRVVAANIARSRWRRHVRLGQLLRRSESPDVPEMSPDRILIYTAIRDLPPRYQRAVALHYIADLPVDEIARTLGVSVSTVKTRLHRARETLRRRLGADPTVVPSTP